MVRHILMYMLVALFALAETPAWAQEHEPSAGARSSTSKTIKTVKTKMPVERTARLLLKNDWRVGLLKTEYGITNYLSLGAYHLYYAAMLPNLTTKVGLWQSRRSALSFSAGVFYADTDLLWFSDAPPNSAWFVAIPLELLGTLQISETLFVTSGVQANLGIGKGEFDAGTTQGLGAMQQIVVPLNLEWALSDFVLMGLNIKYSPWASITGEGKATVQLTEATTAAVEGGGAVDPQAVKNAFSAVAYMLLRWETFNIRLGGGWGSFSVPGLNFMAANRMPLVDLDFFWRF